MQTGGQGAFVDADVRPMTDPQAQASAVLWDDGRVVLVGPDAAVAAEARRRGIEPESLGGRVVLPGFVDAHMHLLHLGLRGLRLWLDGTASLEEALQRVAAYAQRTPGPIVTEAWDESQWDEPRFPTRHDLDAIDASRPLVMRRVDGHTAVANAVAARLLAARWPDAVDLESGLLLEEPSLYLNDVIPMPANELAAALEHATATALSEGCTAIGAYERAPFRRVCLEAARAARLRVRLVLSIYPQQLDDAMSDGFRTGRVHGPAAGPPSVGAAVRNRSPPHVVAGPCLWDGGLKLFLDGSIGGRTAALREPYADAGHRGRLTYSDEELTALVRRAHQANIQVHAHAIGDAAIDQGLQAFAAVAAPQDGAGADGTSTPASSTTASAAPARASPTSTPTPSSEPPAGPRHRFEHFELAHDDQVQEAARLGVIASVQPNFVGAWSRSGGLYERALGSRYVVNNRFQTFAAAGLRMAFGSDGMPFGPRHGLQAAVDHPDAAQRMDAATAVWHYTAGAAYSLHLEEVLGSLQAGRLADMVVLDHPWTTEPGQWRIDRTVLGGTHAWNSTRP